jgi:hypothetical protein
MPSISLYKDVEVLVDVDLDEFDDDDLLDEIASRGLGVSAESKDIITQIWQLRRTNQPYDHLMDDLIYDTIGKLV